MLTTVALLALTLQQAQLQRFADDPRQDALRYTLELDVDPEGRTLTGVVHYRFLAVADLDVIRLDARQGPRWQVRFLSDSGAPLTARWQGDQVAVQLAQKVPAGHEFSFAAHLQGTPPGGFYFKKNRYGEALAFTDHYAIRARGWLPCEDNPADRASFRTTLTFPDNDQALASGGAPKAPARGEAARTAGRRTILRQTQTEIPPYMFAVVVGPFAALQEPGDERLRPHLIYRRDVKLARKALIHNASWLQLMEQTFGPYAYARYRIVQCPTRWGGFEAPGNVLVAENLFDGASGGVATLAHELTHMWFGDGVGYARWREVWLSEGFASYFGPWLLSRSGGVSLRDALRALRARWRRSPEGRTKTVRWAGFSNPDQALNANTYPKGAWVLHMLRGELGDKAFWAGIRAYYLQYRGKSVVTEDFVRSLQASTGKDLHWFFAQWLDRTDCPELQVLSGAGTITVMQKQEAAPFRFRLSLRWSDDEGKSIKRVFEIRRKQQSFQVAGGVHALVVDPDAELLYR